MTLNCFTLNIFGLPITSNLTRKFHISSLAKIFSMKFSFLRCLHQFFSPRQMLLCTRDLSTHVVSLDRVESKASCFSKLLFSHWLSFISFSPPQYYIILLYSIANFMLNVLRTSCLLSFCCLTTYWRFFFLPLTFILVHLSNVRVSLYFQSFIPFYSELWNSLPASTFLFFYDLYSFKRKFWVALLDL